MAFYGGEVTVTGTATSLQDLLGLSGRVFKMQQVDILAASANTGVVSGGGSNVTTSTNRRFVLEQGKAWSALPGSGWLVDLGEIFLIGPGTSEKVYIAAIG